jgi:hypothetical protein
VSVHWGRKLMIQIMTVVEDCYVEELLLTTCSLFLLS